MCDEPGRYRIDVDFDSARAADDAGGGVLLRRARPPQERIEHDELRGVFAQKALNTVSDGLLFGNPGQLVTQAIAAVAAMLYSGLMSFVLLKIIGAVTPRRSYRAGIWRSGKDALIKIGIGGMTMTEVRGHGQQKGHTTVYRGQEYAITLLPKMQVEVVMEDHLVPEAITAVIESARTGQIGDGRIFTMPVLGSYRIRTGELDI